MLESDHEDPVLRLMTLRICLQHLGRIALDENIEDAAHLIAAAEEAISEKLKMEKSSNSVNGQNGLNLSVRANISLSTSCPIWERIVDRAPDRT